MKKSKTFGKKYKKNLKIEDNFLFNTNIRELVRTFSGISLIKGSVEGVVGFNSPAWDVCEHGKGFIKTVLINWLVIKTIDDTTGFLVPYLTSISVYFTRGKLITTMS